MINHRHTQGFTLIEVLIALVILAIGLLGMATLMMNSLQSSQGAYQRSQASLLTYDLLERMRANHDQAVTTDDYVMGKDDNIPSDPGCKANGCSPRAQAQQDLHDWRTALEEGLPDAKASIERENDNEYTIEIEWQEAGLADDTPPPTFSLRVDL